MKFAMQMALGMAILVLASSTSLAGGSGYIPGTMGRSSSHWGLLGGAGPPGGPVGFGPYRPFGCGAGIYSAPWYLFYPYDGYFQNPAPPAYPYWPNQSAGRPNQGSMLPGAYVPGQGNAPFYWSNR
jgi:hypothetical protein